MSLNELKGRENDGSCSLQVWKGKERLTRKEIVPFELSRSSLLCICIVYVHLHTLRLLELILDLLSVFSTDEYRVSKGLSNKLLFP